MPNALPEVPCLTAEHGRNIYFEHSIVRHSPDTSVFAFGYAVDAIAAQPVGLGDSIKFVSLSIKDNQSLMACGKCLPSVVQTNRMTASVPPHLPAWSSPGDWACPV